MIRLVLAAADLFADRFEIAALAGKCGMDDEVVRRSFTQRVTEHARTFELAREILGVS